MLRIGGAAGEFELRADIETPFEVNVSDRLDDRAYFWNRRPELLATLDDADLSSTESVGGYYKAVEGRAKSDVLRQLAWEG